MKVNFPDRKSTVNQFQVGVTGGIGSGKSTVCSMLKKLGRVVISADEIARDLTNHDSAVQQAIRQQFGEKVFTRTGSLNRKALAEIVFANPKKMATLNGIVHPLVFNRINKAIEDLSPNQSSPYVAIEAALIFETGMDERLEYVLVVTAEENARVERVAQRDKVSPDDVRARMNTQLDEKAKTDLADFVIRNDGTESELLDRVKFIDRLLQTLARQPA